MRRLVPAGLAILTVAVAGCSSGFDEDRGDAQKGGTLAVALATPPDSLDPAVARSADARQVLWLAYTAPMTYRHAGGADGTRVVPALASAAPRDNDDHTRFTFTFRRGLRYSDGRGLRASDFARGLRRARTLNPVARRALRGVRVETDDAARTVTLTLRTADPELPRLLAEPWAAPMPPGVPMNRAARGPLPGIGPYSLNRSARGQAYSLSRRYRFELPNVPTGNADAITGRVVRDRAARTRQGLDGRVDVVAGEPPAADLPRIRSEDKERYREFRTLDTRALTFRLDRAPFDDSDARQAVGYALDLQTLTRLEEGFLMPSCNVLPPQVAGYERLQPCPFGGREGDPDLVRAERLARRARGRKRPVLVDPGTGTRAPALGGYVVDTLDKIGFRARVARTPRQRRRAQLRVGSLTSSDASPGDYFSGIDDAAVASDTGALVRESSAAAAASRWARIDDDAVSEALVAPFGVRTTGILLSRRLDAANCLRFSPIYGTDLSSLCLK